MKTVLVAAFISVFSVMTSASELSTGASHVSISFSKQIVEQGMANDCTYCTTPSFVMMVKTGHSDCKQSSHGAFPCNNGIITIGDNINFSSITEKEGGKFTVLDAAKMKQSQPIDLSGITKKLLESAKSVSITASFAGGSGVDFPCEVRGVDRLPGGDLTSIDIKVQTGTCTATLY